MKELERDATLGTGSILTHPTELLEQELKELSERLTKDQFRFAQVRDTLKGRRELATRDKVDDQPAPKLMTSEQRLQELLDEAHKEIRTFTIKVIAMEAEQGKLVVEAEAAKYDARVAQDKLMLVSKSMKSAVVMSNIDWGSTPSERPACPGGSDENGNCSTCGLPTMLHKGIG